MVYSTDSPLLGAGQASASQIQAWLKSHAQDGASYVQLPVAPLPADLGQAIVEEARLAGINSDILAGQIAHESSYAQSRYARERNNYSGMGAVNDNPDLAITFASPRAGVHAQASHLLSYILGANNPQKADDPRYAATTGSDMFGRARTLHDLDQHWAWSPQAQYDAAPASQRYGAMIAAHANDLLSFAASQGGSSTVSVSDFYGVPLAWMPAADGNFDTSRGKVRLFIVHDEEASTAMSAVNRFQTPGQQASSHFVTDPANGRIIQCVGTGNTAYTCGNYVLNQVSVNVENPGFEGKPYPDAVVDYCARVGAYCANKFNIPIVRLSKQEVAAGKAGFCGHEDIPDPDHPGQWGGTDHHTDPGATWPWDKFLSLVRQYAGQGGTVQPQGNVTPPKPVTPPAPVYQERQYFPETQHSVSGGFKRFRDKLESEEPGIVGAPVSEEFTDEKDGYRKQAFERCVMEWQGQGKGGWPHNDWDVFLARVGAGDPTVVDFQARHPEAFAPVKG